MKFLQLRHALEQNEKRSLATKHAQVLAHLPNKPPLWSPLEKRQSVVGGTVRYKPVNQTAALVVSKCPWWAKLLPETVKPEPKPAKRKRRHMSDPTQQKVKPDYITPTSGITKTGVRVIMQQGKEMFYLEDVEKLVLAEVTDQLAKLVNPKIKAAQDARAILDELLHGIGSDMEKFKTQTRLYLEDIRQTRFSVVTESAHITKGLAEIRQFFIGSDYKEQRERLTEFVDLCERLQKLKESGFLDRVADTLLRLAQ